MTSRTESTRVFSVKLEGATLKAFLRLVEVDNPLKRTPDEYFEGLVLSVLENHLKWQGLLKPKRPRRKK